MSEKYVYWNKEMKIIRKNNIRSRLYILSNNSYEGFHNINNSAKDILLSIDGIHTYKEVCSKLASKYKDSCQNVNNVIEDFLFNMKKYNVELLESESPILKQCIIEGREDVYPQAVSIEITERCNLKCIHCYGNFGPDSRNEISMDKLKKLLSDLKKIKVISIELTGGDITMHPKLLEIVKMTVNFGFERVTLLTNGVALSQELMDYIVLNKDRIGIQIDLHSLDESYYNWFTNSSNCLKKVKKNINYLCDKNVFVRVVSIITKSNINEMNDLAAWVQERGAIWSTGLCERVGRAEENNGKEELYLNNEEKQKYFITLYHLREMNNKLGWLPPEEELINEHNCGVLTGHTVISTSGRVKLCTMEKIPNFQMGNVFKNNIKDIFDENKTFLEDFALYEPPKFNADECNDCIYKSSCNACILQNIQNIRKMEFNCNWYINNKQNAVTTVINKIFALKG